MITTAGFLILTILGITIFISGLAIGSFRTHRKDAFMAKVIGKIKDWEEEVKKPFERHQDKP